MLPVKSNVQAVLTAGKRRFVHSVGFEPTSISTVDLESTPLDRSGMNACAAFGSVKVLNKNKFFVKIASVLLCTYRCVTAMVKGKRRNG
jgi:hypothetical protein